MIPNLDTLPPHKRVAKIRQLPYDANNAPYGFDDAKWAAAKALADFINELPEHFSRVNGADVELCTERMLAAYRQSLERSLQRLWDQR